MEPSDVFYIMTSIVLMQMNCYLVGYIKNCTTIKKIMNYIDTMNDGVDSANQFVYIKIFRAYDAANILAMIGKPIISCRPDACQRMVSMDLDELTIKIERMVKNQLIERGIKYP